MPLHPLHRYIFPSFFREVIWIQSLTDIIQLQKKALIDPLQPATKSLQRLLELTNSAQTVLDLNLILCTNAVQVGTKKQRNPNVFNASIQTCLGWNEILQFREKPENVAT